MQRPAAIAIKQKVWITAMKKLIALAAVGIAIFAVYSATDPNVKRRVEQERQEKAKEQQEKQQEWADGWKKWAEESKKKTDERVKQQDSEPGFENGFQFGYIAGKLTRTKTNIQPPTATIDRLAKEQLTKQNVPPESHQGFVRGFSAGWSFGWTSK